MDALSGDGVAILSARIARRLSAAVAGVCCPGMRVRRAFIPNGCPPHGPPARARAAGPGSSCSAPAGRDLTGFTAQPGVTQRPSLIARHVTRGRGGGSARGEERGSRCVWPAPGVAHPNMAAARSSDVYPGQQPEPGGGRARPSVAAVRRARRTVTARRSRAATRSSSSCRAFMVSSGSTWSAPSVPRFVLPRAARTFRVVMYLSVGARWATGKLQFHADRMVRFEPGASARAGSAG